MAHHRSPASRTRTKKRVLIVNCYFDDSRQPIRRTNKVPQAVGPIYLAGAFSPELCEVRCYSELASGPLEDEHLLSWPDMLVLTGLTNSLDRMLHITAYTRTKNPYVIAVAGGPTVRALPLLTKRFFDYTCSGDIEELREVISDAFGPSFVEEEMFPRYELGYWLGRIGYVETSRNCNFRCDFCSLTGEERRYQTYSLDYIRRQILALGKRRRIFFHDNNFYGSDRAHFNAKLQLIEELGRAGYFHHWGALVTNDFFRHEQNFKQVKKAGCEFLFSGLESFDNDWLRNVNKLQNTSTPQVELVRRTLSSGIVFAYGLMLDVSTRSLANLRSELDFITRTPEITLPSFVTLAIPLLGTPHFFDCVVQGSILPSTKLRDMDGTTIVLRPLDQTADVVKFVSDLQNLRGYRLQIAKHTAGFAERYRSRLTKMQMVMALGNGLLICAQPLATSFTGLGWFKRSEPRTFVSTTEPLDTMYSPAFRVDSRFERYFKPTMITDESGELHEDMLHSGLMKPSLVGRAAARR